MDMLEVHEQARLCANTFYNDFLYRLDPKKKQIFVFYEGDEDSSFFRKFIERPGYKLEELISGCKNNVIKNYNDLKKCGYDVNHMVFIVDRDLSFWLREPNPDAGVFVTEGYSVENYIVCDEVFEKLIIQVKGFARCTKVEKERMCGEFKRLLKEYNTSMQRIMACAVLAKIKDRKAQLSLLKHSKFLNITLVDGSLKINISYPNDISNYWGIREEDNEEVSKIIASFQRNTDQYHVRGKWLLPFMIEIAEKMRLSARVFAPTLDTDVATQTCSIEATKGVGVLGPRCMFAPAKFLKYLEGRVS